MSGLPNKFAIIIYVLSFFFLLMAGLSALDMVLGGRKPKKNKEVFRKISGTRQPNTEKANMDDYIAIRPDRFCGRTNEGHPIFRQKGTGFSAIYLLRGTLIHSNPSLSCAFIEVPGAAEQQAYRIGDDVHGARLVSISKEKAQLLRGEETIDLQVSYADRTPPKNQKGKKNSFPPGSSMEELLRRLPPAARALWAQATPKQKQQFMKLPPKERMNTLRKLMRRLQKEQRLRNRNTPQRRNKRRNF